MSTNQTETETQAEIPEETQEELTTEEIAELVREAMEKGQEEAKLIYVIHEERRYGGCGWVYLFHYGDYKIVYGDVDEVELDYENDEDQCLATRTTAFIPKTKTVVIYVENRDQDPQYKTCDMLLVFRYPVGWKRLELCKDKIQLS